MPKRLPFSSGWMAWVFILSLVSLYSIQPDAFAAKYEFPPDHSLNDFEKEVIYLVNQERQKTQFETTINRYRSLLYVTCQIG
jgi:hypothetical protein